MDIFKPNKTVDPISISDREAAKLIGGPRGRTYQGDSPFADIINDYRQSGSQPGFATADMVYNPIYQTYGSSSDLGAMKNFIDDQFNQMLRRMQQMDVKTPEFNDRFKMYSDAMFAFDDSRGQEGLEFGQLEPPSLGPFDPNFVPSSPFDPVTSGGQEPKYSAGNPGSGIDDTIPPQLVERMPIPPSFQPPSFQPPNMGSNHSHDEILQGIGDLFEQYFPNQGAKNTQQNLGFSNNNVQGSAFNGPGILGLVLPQRG